jgi:hypothetical protein
VIPSLERLRELLRASGIELSFRLAVLDTSDHDDRLIACELSRTPAERLRSLARVAQLPTPNHVAVIQKTST